MTRRWFEVQAPGGSGGARRAGLAGTPGTWQLSPQHLANTAWALATLAVKDFELLESVQLAAVCKTWELNPQDQANTAWAFATLAVEDSEL